MPKDIAKDDKDAAYILWLGFQFGLSEAINIARAQPAPAIVKKLQDYKESIVPEHPKMGDPGMIEYQSWLPALDPAAIEVASWNAGN